MLKIRVTPPVGLCKDWNFTEQAVKFLEPFELTSFTAAKELLNFCAEKGTSLLLLSWNIQINWLLLSL